MKQSRLYYDSALESVDLAIADSAFTHKQVASHLWPAKKPATAYARLKACLNEEKDEKFSFEEIIEICRYVERFDPLYFFEDECSHTRSQPRTPEDEDAALMREFISHAKRMDGLMARLEKKGKF
ncbi:hypothetical protein TDB9533_01249 [Thalassocella blandensis]|nr:hypothetical protein TDB9533_01249 [Thalassocella blandensis]